MNAGLVQWQWRARQAASAPQAAVAWGDAARRLHARLKRMAEGELAGLEATANGEVLVITGRPDTLPWVEGVQYACAEPAAPGLWLPTSWEPDAPLDLLGQALLARFPRAPLLLWHAPAAVVPLDRCLPVTAQHLQRIEHEWAAH
ncbi:MULTISPECIES: hypothetical protein [unclassified Pseudomonas]|uniref:bpX5 domain-containing protein n=1 Tax=unclassified Pseudomonas TaxID=196821 RepID=UPI000BD6ADA2|nr:MULTISPECIES: hypothetical protein [unclassified Pseudomonas]PVZ20169.1 hypothetical protein F474_00762 [Pseudomonas sp. URIL14HWK12:I12]PVZ27235.1 hypothetical protein F470_00417 [Pseudomonas sp. URIL14HWK12:I10]PVZ38124.1 hypothetical protein F472_00762 [Pseudomonas sp. URIL14HWK12:I11]SNZ04488.1 hypothetical protein SAMN05660463_00642 [Pseudomonas sp. URIL14HWK12:I9]